MRNALPPNKHKEMLELLGQGYSAKVVSEWLGVIIEYVIEHSQEVVEVIIEPQDPYTGMTDAELAKVNLKDFRKYVQDNIDFALASNSKLSNVISVYRANNNKEVNNGNI